ncbi:iron uptake porin [Cyanobium sp. FGCU-52]|nr:iron uptake porin [Cyanobium sp. FGCU52]
MKIFQHLLVAPAALGLVAPMAVSAAELNLDGINQYASKDQVTSISQFSDVNPSDWAYQALSNLIERYGCVAGYPNGTYKGGQAMTRYEAAALLNACLDRITEVTDELKRLMKEFEKELAVLRGRVDGLEAKVGELEATQFSTTTKLQGDVVFVLGAPSFGGSQDAPSLASGASSSNRNKYAATNRENWGATTFNYDVRLNLNTSFTGKDLLYTRLRAGNFANSAFNGNPYNLMALDRAYSTNGQNEVIGIDRLYYRFPIGSSFTALIGPRARNTEFLAIRPWFYDSGILDVFTLHGAPATYNKATGATAGLMWKQNVKKGKPYFAASTSYVAPNGDNSNPNEGGLFNDASRASFTTQLGLAGRQWALAAAWRYGQCGDNMTRRGTQFARQALDCAYDFSGSAYSNNFAVTAAWQPVSSGWIPSISLGWGISTINQADFDVPQAYGSRTNITETQSWSVGLQWSDVLIKGNSLGMAVGQPTFVTALDNNDGFDAPNDGNYAWEWWYRFQVTDNISITPALFYLSRPNGQYTANGETNSVFGGLVQTQFKF